MTLRALFGTAGYELQTYLPGTDPALLPDASGLSAPPRPDALSPQPYAPAGDGSEAVLDGLVSATTTGFGTADERTAFDVVSTWNSVKNAAVTDDEAADLAFAGFVHVDAALGLASDLGSSLEIAGAKRGNLTTGAGADRIEVQTASNRADWSNEFRANTGAGDDTVRFSPFDSAAAAAAGDRTFGPGTETNRLRGYDGSNTLAHLDLGDGADDLALEGFIRADARGGGGADRMALGNGADVARGDDGDDSLAGGRGTDFLDGGNGADTILGQGGLDIVVGGAGNDVIFGDEDAAEATVPLPLTPIAQSYLAAGRNLINGLGGSAGFGERVLARNDDGSTDAIDVFSVFGPDGLNFAGTAYTSIYVNNNGNVTFAGPTGATWPSGPLSFQGQPVVAALWSDVYTSNGLVTPTPGGNSTGSNLVHYDLDSANGVVTVTWDDVWYYGGYGAGAPNAFQMQLIARGQGDFDIVLRYEDINWPTTGGTARAGYSAGNGMDHYELPMSGDLAGGLALESTPGNTGQPGVWVIEVRDGAVSIEGEDVIDGGPGQDTLTGGAGRDIFVLRRGEADGDAVMDFQGEGSVTADQLRFEGYGTAAEGATLVRLDAERWQVNSADGLAQDVITLGEGAGVQDTNHVFV